MRVEIRSREPNTLRCAKKKRKSLLVLNLFQDERKKGEGKQMRDVKCINLFRELTKKKIKIQNDQRENRVAQTACKSLPIGARSLRTKQRDVIARVSGLGLG